MNPKNKMCIVNILVTILFCLALLFVIPEKYSINCQKSGPNEGVCKIEDTGLLNPGKKRTLKLSEIKGVTVKNYDQVHRINKYCIRLDVVDGDIPIRFDCKRDDRLNRLEASKLINLLNNKYPGSYSYEKDNRWIVVLGVLLIIIITLRMSYQELKKEKDDRNYESEAIIQNETSAGINLESDNLDTLIQKGYILIDKKMIKNAISLFSNLLITAPDNAKLFAGLSYGYYHANEYKKSIKAGFEALKLDPQNDFAHRVVASSLVNYKKDFKKALSHAKQALTINPFDYANFLLLSEIYFCMGDFKKCREYALKTLEIKPDQPIAFLLLSHYYKHTYDFRQAKEYLIKSLELSPNDPVVLNEYGILLLALGKNVDGYRLFKDAILQQPDNKKLQDNLKVGFRLSHPLFSPIGWLSRGRLTEDMIMRFLFPLGAVTIIIFFLYSILVFNLRDKFPFIYDGIFNEVCWAVGWIMAVCILVPIIILLYRNLTLPIVDWHYNHILKKGKLLS